MDDSECALSGFLATLWWFSEIAKNTVLVTATILACRTAYRIRGAIRAATTDPKLAEAIAKLSEKNPSTTGEAAAAATRQLDVDDIDDGATTTTMPQGWRDLLETPTAAASESILSRRISRANSFKAPAPANAERD